VSLVRCAQSKGTLIKQCEKLFTKALMHNGVEYYIKELAFCFENCSDLHTVIKNKNLKSKAEGRKVLKVLRSPEQCIPKMKVQKIFETGYFFDL
jgi:hypothetical protein